MRTNIDIDDALMSDAMKAGPYKTKKDAVEAGLKLLARQAAYREVLKWRGKLEWQGDDAVDWTAPTAQGAALVAAEPAPRRAAARVKTGGTNARR
ncbi:MAG: type II toxin-antitoxin system VapB family antitoxin [Rubrivivax sp.]